MMRRNICISSNIIKRLFSTSRSDGYMIGVDWGTTNFRAYLLDDQGKVLDSSIDPGAGINNVTGQNRGKQFERILHSNINHWPNVPVLMCGMIGSRHGWSEVPYVETSCSIKDIIHGCSTFEMEGSSKEEQRQVMIVPGVSHCGHESKFPDAMRGEETQLMGIIDNGKENHIVCLPGTHSKWANLSSSSRLVSFQTYMTGELFDLLSHHSILSKLMTGESSENKNSNVHSLENCPGFRKGVLMGSQIDVSLSSSLFSARSCVLFDQIRPEQARSYLSGLLIGHEIAYACSHILQDDEKKEEEDATISIIGTDDLVELYSLACQQLGIKANVEGDTVCNGLFKIMSAIHSDSSVSSSSLGVSSNSQGYSSSLSSPSSSSSRSFSTIASPPLHSTIPLSSFVADNPLIAILRGIRPDKVLSYCQPLVEDCNFSILEIPLNSPSALDSIAILAKYSRDLASSSSSSSGNGRQILIGAGTVLSTQQVEDVYQAGGRLIVSPNANVDVVKRAKELGMVAIPGVATPTEAFQMLEAGADGLKLFPAEQLNPKILKAWFAVLPNDTLVFPVGGVTPSTMQPYLDVGAQGFGLGSSLYNSTMTLDQVLEKANDFNVALKQHRQSKRGIL